MLTSMSGTEVETQRATCIIHLAPRTEGERKQSRYSYTASWAVGSRLRSDLRTAAMRR